MKILSVLDSVRMHSVHHVDLTEPRLVESAGYVPIKARIEALLQSGDTLRRARREDYSYDTDDVGSDDDIVLSPYDEVVDVDEKIRSQRSRVAARLSSVPDTPVPSDSLKDESQQVKAVKEKLASE